MPFLFFAPATGWKAALAGALVAGVAIASHGPAPGQEPAAPPKAKAKAAAAARPADPKAKALLNEVVKAYKALGSYSDEGQFRVAMTIGGKQTKQTLPLKLTFVRPNKLDLDAGPVHVVSDGKTLTTAIVPLKRYTASDAPEVINFETFRQGPTGAVLFGGPSGAPMFVLLNLLTSADPAAALEQLGGALQLGPEDPKSPATSLIIDQEDQAPDIRLVVDPATKLLSRIDFQIDTKALARNAPEGQKVSVEEFGWNAGAVKTEVAKDHLFAFDPPKGFTKVDDLVERQGGDQEQKFAVSEKVGSPAPDFTLTLLDGPDKTRTVTRAELAGKVVVIDFWATWCGPCLQELPEIQKLVETLAKDKKDVMVVALSQDVEPAELAEVRKLVEKTLTDKKISLTGNAVGRVALDPSGSVGKAFEVEGLPTVVILDGKGVVQSAHVGYSPEIREKLAAEIDALLAGKPISKDKNKPVEAAGKAAGEKAGE